MRERNPSVRIDEDKVAGDMEKYGRLLGKRYPDRTLYNVKNPAELTGAYKRHWIYM
ncbi:hypothetical protein ACFLRF_01320 [Candidatus Altiarchaeota archaeon]